MAVHLDEDQEQMEVLAEQAHNAGEHPQAIDVGTDKIVRQGGKAHLGGSLDSILRCGEQISDKAEAIGDVSECGRKCRICFAKRAALCENLAA